MHRNPAPGLVLALLLVGTAGCATWQNATANPTAALATGPTRVRVQAPGTGHALLVHDPAIEGDSLIGWIEAGGGRERSATALQDVSRLDVPAPAYAAAGAAGVALGTAALVALVALLQAASRGT